MAFSRWKIMTKGQRKTFNTTMKNLVFQIFILAALCITSKAQDISRYNVVWNSQSKNSSESMPLGGGDIGCNVWTENNDILFYISRSGTFDENNSFLKLGRVRLSLYPNPFKNSFKQELKLKYSCYVN